MDADRRAQLWWGLEDRWALGTASQPVVGSEERCVPSRWPKMRREDAGRREQMEPRAQSGLGPSVRRRGGTAETPSGTVRAWRPSANFPDSFDEGRQENMVSSPLM